MSNSNKIIESQKQFVDNATKLCENNNLLNTILRMEKIVNQYSGLNKRLLLNLVLPIASLVFWQLRKAINDGFPQGKDFLIDMLYCDNLLLRINWIVWICYISFVSWIFIFGGVDHRLWKLFIAIIFFYVATLYPLIEMLESFNQLKIELIKANQVSIKTTGEIIKLANNGIVDSEQINLDFQIKQQIGALVSELAKIEFKQRCETVATIDKRYLPIEIKQEKPSRLQKNIKFFIESKNKMSDYKEEFDNQGKQVLNNHKDAVSSIGKNPHIIEYIQNIKDHGIDSPNEIILSIGHDILRNLHQRINEAEQDYSEKQNLRNYIKSISKLMTQVQYDPENLMKISSLNEIFTESLKIMKINKDGSMVVNIKHVENMNSPNNITHIANSTLKGSSRVRVTF